KKAIQVSKIWHSSDSDTEDEANDERDFKVVHELSYAMSNLSLSNNELKDSVCYSESNDTVGGNDANTILEQKDDEYGADHNSDTSGTLDVSSEGEQDERQPCSTDRGGGDADLNLDTDTSSQIIKVNVAFKKRDRDPEAYKKWLKSKNEEIRKNREKEMMTKLLYQRQKELDEQTRKEENKKKIQEWMERKKQGSCKQNINGNPVNNPNSSRHSPPDHLLCDPDAKYKSWLHQVRKREEERRIRDQAVKELEKKIQEEKKKMSEEVYQGWLKGAKHKPKPVPLNQGPHTLRGTVSSIFINPEPWKSNVKE
uniref:Coiled-coil domain-containing protein n=1 Tax=Anopheles epiroticus TaxID=199890 RepID=A0A182P9X2_9DIPT